MKPHAMLRSALALWMAAALCAPGNAQEEGSLTIRVISGDLAINNVRHYVPEQTVIEVRDESGRPVNAAAVTFRFPATGPSGAFADGSRSSTVPSDAQGRVTLPRFAPNLLAGSYQIVVSAGAAGRAGTTQIQETNAFTETAGARRGIGSGGKLLVVLGISAAVAAGSLIAIKGSSVGDHAAVPPTSLSLGPISIGAPH